MPEDGVLLLNGDEPLLRAMKPDGVSVKFVSLEKQDADFAVSNIRYDKNGYQPFLSAHCILHFAFILRSYYG